MPAPCDVVSLFHASPKPHASFAARVMASATCFSPAVGQGALAIETRGPGLPACEQLNHPPTQWAVTAERALLAALGGGCQVPIGAYATVAGDRLSLKAVVVSPDGVHLVHDRSEG